MKLFSSSLVAGVILAVALATTVRADDILANSDFHDGMVQWKGDGVPADNGQGIVITLNPNRWSALSQRVDANGQRLHLKISFIVSQGSSIHRNHQRFPMHLSGGQLEKILNFPAKMPNQDCEFGNTSAFMVQMYDSEGSLRDTYDAAFKGPDDGQPDTATADIYDSGGNRDRMLVLALPPGTGTVTITSVSLTPVGDNS